MESLNPILNDAVEQRRGSYIADPVSDKATSENRPKNKKNKISFKFPKAGDAIFKNPEIFQKPEDLIMNRGYFCETHEVTTEDGYILSLFRIPYPQGKTGEISKNQSTTPNGSNPTGHDRPVVLFAHGIMTSGVSWILNSDKNVLPYQLADQGFDCWLLNARGCEFSKKHSKLSPNSRKFWNFSWHDMGEFDIPAVLSYILKLVNQDNLIYIGHSMGCAVLFVATSMFPEISQKIKLMIAYAPAVYLKHAKTPFVKVAARTPGYQKFTSWMYHGEFYLRSGVELTRKFAPWIWICGSRNVRDSTWISWKMIDQVNGPDPEQINWPMMPVIAGHLPSPTSAKTYAHFLQSHKCGKFQNFDHGSSKNLKKYGQEKPPEYDLSKSTFPVGIFYGDNDACVVPEDVLKLSKDLPNVALVHRVDWPEFSHVGFIFAKDADELLNRYVIELINKHM